MGLPNSAANRANRKSWADSRMISWLGLGLDLEASRDSTVIFHFAPLSPSCLNAVGRYPVDIFIVSLLLGRCSRM